MTRLHITHDLLQRIERAGYVVIPREHASPTALALRLRTGEPGAEAVDEPRRPRMSDIVSAVVESYDVPRERLMGPSRAQEYAFPRQVAMLIGVRAGHAASAVGRHFGRDHTTVLHGVSKIEWLLARDDVMALKVQVIAERAGQISAIRRRQAQEQMFEVCS